MGLPSPARVHVHDNSALAIPHLPVVVVVGSIIIIVRWNGGFLLGICSRY